MPDPIERKRLKKKMLDRWENEGGRIVTDSAGDDSRPASEQARRGKHPAASRGNPAVGGPAAPTKRRKANRK